MALGGGGFTTQNEVLPGAYINFVSAASASATLSDRGVATMPLELDWGKEGEIFEVSNEDFQKNTLRIFGYAFDDDRMKGLADLFLNAKTLYAYRLNGGGVKASNMFATALYGGVRGNDIKIVIQVNADNTDLFDVTTYIGTVKVDSQTVHSATNLVANDYVTFKADAVLTATASTPLAGGTNGTVDGAAHQTYLDKVESYTCNAMGIAITDAPTEKLYAAFQKRLRNEMGIKFQLIVYRLAADDIGVISVENKIIDKNWSEASLVYWVTGAECACAVNKSCQNKKYDGSFTIDTGYTQTELSTAIKAGKFVMHKVNSDVRVLDDINTFVSTTDVMGDVFKDNQTVRVIDQIGNDDAVLFNTKYLGVVPNKPSGRTSLWSDLVKSRNALQDLGAIEDFTDSDVTVVQGDTKKSVVVSGPITVINAMGKLYMTVMVH